MARAGISGAREEATALWAGLEGSSPGAVWLSRDRATRVEQVGAFQDAVRRRAAGEPLAYVVGCAGFRTLSLRVDRRVLIPRPETEGLVDHVLAWGRRRRDAPGAWGRALDIGTGSGCIALSLAVEGRFREVVATDVSGDALAVARANAAAAAASTPVTFREGPFFGPVAGEVFAVIAANPPYLTEDEFEWLDRGVREHEPRGALAAGPDGLRHLRRLLDEGRSYLEPGGLLVLELDCARAGAVRALARGAGWHDVSVERDLFGRDRYLLAIGVTA